MKVLQRMNTSVDCGYLRFGRFDIALTFCGNVLENHILEITMKFFLRKITVAEFTSSTAGIKGLEDLQWSESEWSEFKRKFIAAGTLWHKRFCLVPPDSADEFSIKDGSYFLRRTYMPNIECHFKPVLVEKEGDQHWTVKVTKVKKGDSSFPSETGPFGSDLSSDDGESNARSHYNPKTLEGFTLTQIAAAHEIGHMLGQPHVGQLKNTAACVRALKLEADNKPPEGEDARYFIGGANASVCYGWTGNTSDVNVAQNIMGLGLRVEEINAVSWRNSVAQVMWDRKELPSDWKTISGAYRNPRLISG
jgi:hypothetical protein